MKPTNARQTHRPILNLYDKCTATTMTPLIFPLTINNPSNKRIYPHTFDNDDSNCDDHFGSDINSVKAESDYSNSERNDYESTSHDQFSLFIYECQLLRTCNKNSCHSTFKQFTHTYVIL